MDFTLHTTFPDELEAEWNDLLERSISHVPFLRHEYQRGWWSTRGGGEWPEADLTLVTARQDGRLVGVAPLFRAAARQDGPSLLLVGSIEISDYLDFVAPPGDLEPFTSGLLPFLLEKVPSWQTLDLYNILDSSPTLAALEKAAGQNRLSYRVEKLQHSPYIPLPGDWETYLSQIDKKQRHEIRRKMRRAEESGRKVEWGLTEDPARLEADLEDFLALMRQDPEKDAFLTPPMTEHFCQIIRCAFQAGCLHFSYLKIDGQKAAAHLSFDYLNRIWAYNSGVSKEFNELSPGWVLLGYELQWANEHGYSEYDFMRGDEEYKYRFGAIDRSVMRVSINK